MVVASNSAYPIIRTFISYSAYCCFSHLSFSAGPNNYYYFFPLIFLEATTVASDEDSLCASEPLLLEHFTAYLLLFGYVATFTCCLK